MKNPNPRIGSNFGLSFFSWASFYRFDFLPTRRFQESLTIESISDLTDAYAFVTYPKEDGISRHSFLTVASFASSAFQCLLQLCSLCPCESLTNGATNARPESDMYSWASIRLLEVIFVNKIQVTKSFSRNLRVGSQKARVFTLTTPEPK